MNENHDPSNGQFSDGSGSSGGGRASVGSRVKGALKGAKNKLQSAHAKLDKIKEKIHSTRLYHELAVKDRFTKFAPPGSNKEAFVKHGAMWAQAGLEKMAVVAAGGGVVGVAAVTTVAYAKYGKFVAQKYGPTLSAKFNATSVGKRLSGLRDRVSNAGRFIGR